MLIREAVSCDLCHNNIYEPLYAKKYFEETYQIVKCKFCELIYMNPRFTKEQNRDLYNDKYYYFSKRDNGLNITKAMGHFKILKNYASKGKLLDIGCGRGFFLKVADENGWETYGVDISDYACKFIRDKLSLNVSSGDLEDIEFPEKCFDVITLWDALEHIRNPRKLLEKAKKLLKKKGILFIETPNINSIFYKLYRRYWLGFNPFHLYYFSPQTLEKILQQVGFKIVKLETIVVNLFSKEGLWIRGLKTPLAEILDTLKLKEKVKKKFVKRKSTKFEKIDFRQINSESLFLHQNKLINLINCPLNHLINNLKMGDHLLVVAQKIN